MQLNFPFMPENNTTPSTSTETPAKASLGLSDLQAVITLIDIVSSRGAFKGQELTAVGNLRDTFERFLKANTPPEPTSPEAAPDENPVSAQD